MKYRSSLILLLPALALAGCQEAGKPVNGGKVGGEILEASVSDAMLPLDTVRSQPPLAPTADGKTDAKDDAKDGSTPDSKPGGKPAPASSGGTSAASVTSAAE